MARTNDMLNKKEFLHRINALRWEIRKRKRLYSGDSEFTNPISSGEVKRLRGILSSWEKQFKERFGTFPTNQSLKKVISESGIDD